MIELFMLDYCAYCQKVMEYLNVHEIPYKKIDISNKANEEALIKIGGKRQVPFIIDKEHGIEMYESRDIIEYLKTLK